MIKGKCLCEGVQYEYDAEITKLAVCHCNMCKRAQGTVLGTNALIDGSKFRLTKGKELLKKFQSSSNKHRVFCGNCGSPLYSQLIDNPDVMRLRVGSVVEGEVPEPCYQIFCDDKSPWFKLDESKPMFPQNVAK
jgi:hypothetical protein